MVTFREPAIALLGLGSNLGDRRRRLTAALDAIHSHPRITHTKVSCLYETSPVGGPLNQPDFLNAAARIETTLDPDALLRFTRQVEQELGRRRPSSPSASMSSCLPRTVDIDLLLYADQTRITETLTIPHPRMHARSFVLRPLADIAPDAVHPLLNRSVNQLLSAVPDHPRVTHLLDPTWWQPTRCRTRTAFEFNEA